MHELAKKSSDPQSGTIRANAPGWRRGPRSLPLVEWPNADQEAWLEACRPGHRLQPGGIASHLGEVSRDDLVRRYGAFLAFLERNDRLDRNAAAASQVTPVNVAEYIAELQARVRSVTVWNCIYKLRRMAQLIGPALDFSWLAEIENDLELLMEPRSKFDRLVLTQVLVEAGLTLINEAEAFVKPGLARAKAVLPSTWTKSGNCDERPVPNFLKATIDKYVSEYRPILMRAGRETRALWLSSTAGTPMTTKGVALTISTTTRRTLGVDVSPHLFRTAAASTAAMYGGNTPHLASAILNHRDPRITEEHYNRATSMSAAQIYAAITESYRGE